MIGSISAEWAKLHSVGASWRLAVGTVIASMAATAAVMGFTHVGPAGPGGSGGSQHLVTLALGGLDLGLAPAALLAAGAITEEYGTGLLAVTLAATPRRLGVLGAKLLCVGGVVLVTGLVAAAGCLLAGRWLAPGAGLGPAHGYPPISIAGNVTLSAGLGRVLLYGLVAVISLGVAAVVRDTAVATGGVLGLLYLPPLLSHLLGSAWGRRIDHLAPLTAGAAVQVAWALGAFTVGAVVLCRRDI